MQSLKNLSINVLNIPFIRDKDSFGDLDLLISNYDKHKLINWLDLNKYLKVINGNVLSIYHPIYKFQIDFIFTNLNKMDYSRNYFSWGCAGNLVGRLIKTLGFKHGHEGLYYVQRDGNYIITEHLLSLNYFETLSILKLDVEKFKQGFNSLEELFIWFTASPYFNLELFKLENLNHTNRLRDSKRKDYCQFLSWCLSEKTLKSNDIISKDDRETFVLNLFPNLKKDIDEFNLYQHKRKQAALKFNGVIVNSITKLKGKDLGNFINLFKSHFDLNWIYNTSQHEINLVIKQIFKYNY